MEEISFCALDFCLTPQLVNIPNSKPGKKQHEKSVTLCGLKNKFAGIMLLLFHLWRLIVVLLSGTLRVAASPSVNVALQASFNSPPYLLELLFVTVNFLSKSKFEANRH